jgi:hypothetical protein
LVVFVAACAASLTAPGSPGEASSTATRPVVTFNKDVAPIVFAHCAGCHRPGQPGPFGLLKYEDFRKRAKQVVEVLEERYMPPWLPEPGHGEFADDRSLTQAQIDVLRSWVAAGAVEGAAGDLPPLPKWTSGWQLGKPDLVVKMPTAFQLPPEGKDVYRNFVFPIPVSSRKLVRGVEFDPGNRTVVHHAFIEVDTTRYSRRLAEKKGAAGLEGMLLPETAFMPGGKFLGWQPGKVPHFEPDGLAWVLETNTDLVLQLHMHPSGKPEVVQPTIAFYFTDKWPTNTTYRINLNPLLIDIPAGQRDYAIEDSYVLPVDVFLVGISPHAHYLGKRLQGTATFPDGRTQDLILIPDWDFNWQGDYQYKEPVHLPKGTRLAMHFTYDNSTDNPRNPNHPPKRVKYGLQTTDEMGELWFQVLPKNVSELKLLGQDFYGHLVQRTLAYNEAILKENPNDAEAHTRAGRALHYLGKLPQALAHLNAATQADPNYDRAYYELGVLYLRLNQVEEAEKAFQNVVRLNPDDYEAQGNLGVVCLRRNDLAGAERHFAAALRINPNDSVAQNYLNQIKAAMR